jgi:hypothetical protein
MNPSAENAKVYRAEARQIALIAWYIFISRSLSIILSAISLKNFGKGLKDRAFPKLSIELFMGGSFLHPYRNVESEELKTRLSEQTPRETEILCDIPKV